MDGLLEVALQNTNVVEMVLTLDRFRWVRADPRLIYIFNIPLYFSKYEKAAAGGNSIASADEDLEVRRQASPSLTILPVSQAQWGRADPRIPSMLHSFTSRLMMEHTVLVLAMYYV